MASTERLWAGATPLADESKAGTPRVLISGSSGGSGLLGNKAAVGVQVSSVFAAPLGSVGEALADAVARQNGRAPSKTPGVMETINTYRGVTAEALFGAVSRTEDTRQTRTVINSGGHRYEVARDAETTEARTLFGFRR